MFARVWPAFGMVLWVAGCGSSPPVERDDSPAPDAGIADPPPVGPPRKVPYQLPPAQSSLQTYELELSETTLELFNTNLYTPEQPATFVYQGQRYPVNVRLRGASARTFPKKSWNVDFEDLRFEGREELNLVAEYQDQTMLVEKLAYDLMEAAQIPAPRTKYVRLLLNGRYQGLYLDIEEVDKRFVKQHELPDADASIYRCGSWDCEMKLGKASYQGDWQKQTNATESRADLAALLEVINHAPEPALVSRLEEIFELDLFLRTMAVEAIIANNYIEDSQSYYIADRVTGRWYYVPWDLNNSDARFWPTYGLDISPIYQHPLWAFTLMDPWLDRMWERRRLSYPGYQPAFCNLRTRILLNPELRSRLLAHTEEARAKLLDPKVLHPHIDRLHAFIEPHMKLDPFVNQDAFAMGNEFVKSFVSKRFAFVSSEIGRLRQQKLGLVLERVDPARGQVEIANRGPTGAHLSGMVVTPNLRHGRSPSNVPPISLGPGQKVTLSAGQLGISLAAQGEIGLFSMASGPLELDVDDPIDVLYYGRLSPGKHYARSASGAWTIAE